MGISETLQQQVEPAVRQRGLGYSNRGAVRLLLGTARTVVAQVTGTRRYRVVLRVPQDRTVLRTQCTCPYFDSYGMCKHVWATLLVAERRGLLTTLKLSRQAALVEEDPMPADQVESLMAAESDASEPADAGLDADWAADAQLDELHGLGRLGERRDASSSWQDDLSALRGSVVSRQADGLLDDEPPLQSTPAAGVVDQLIYVLDLRRTQLENAGLVLTLWTRRRRRDGSWGKRNAARVTRQTLDRWGVEDRYILSLVLGGGAGAEGHYSRYYGDSAFQLEAPSLPTLLPMLAATERLFARDVGDSDQLVPLALDDRGAWELFLRVRAEGSRWLLEGGLRRGDEELALSAPSLVLPSGWVFQQGKLAQLTNPQFFDWVELLRRRRQIEVPMTDGDALLSAIYALPELPPLLLPDELRLEHVTALPRPCLRVFRPEHAARGQQERLHLDLRFTYGEYDVPAMSEVSLVLQPGTRRLVARDRAAERVAIQRLVELGCRPLPRHLAVAGEGRPLFSLVSRKLPPLVRALLGEGWSVEADGQLYRRAGQLSLSVATGIDWFDVQGDADFEGQVVALPRILAAIRRGEREVVLDDGSMGILPEEWLERYGLLGATAEVSADAVRFRSSQVALLDALLAEDEGVHWDSRAKRARTALRTFEQIKPVDPPASFEGVLRPYQREGLGWIEFLQKFGLGGCLADDMGLGKTVQALALLERRRKRRVGDGERRKPSLVVAPKSVVFNWCDEAARFTPQLRVLEHTGPTRTKQAEVLRDCDLLLTTYGVLRKDVLLLREVELDYAMLDEAQAIKNSQSLAAKAARLLRADHRLALSGTPIENHLGELWSLFEFLNPGMLGSSGAFKALSNRHAALDETAGLLARAVRPLVLRRTKDQVAQDLPPKTEQTIYCELERDQRRHYDEIRDHYRAKLLRKLDPDTLRRSKLQVLEALLRLRQAACHPGLIDRKQVDKPSAKLEALLENLEEVVDEGHKALVFSQFTQLLAIVRQRLDARQLTYEYLDGRTRNRAERVKRFQEDPDCKLFLISLKAGGLGLNLTAADYVFLLDPWWNPAVEAQAIDRAHRIGQSRHVFAYRLIAKDTVEEKVVELQQHKRKLADAIISGDNRPLRDLTGEDLELLFS